MGISVARARELGIPVPPRGKGGRAATSDGGEKAFLGQVLQLARLYGWLAYHTHDSRHSAGGFPDLTLVRGGRLVFAELKVGGNTPTPAQVVWLRALEAAGAEAYVWRPGDFDQIQTVLSGGRAAGGG